MYTINRVPQLKLTNMHRILHSSRANIAYQGHTDPDSVIRRQEPLCIRSSGAGVFISFCCRTRRTLLLTNGWFLVTVTVTVTRKFMMTVIGAGHMADRLSSALRQKPLNSVSNCGRENPWRGRTRAQTTRSYQYRTRGEGEHRALSNARRTTCSA